MAKRIVPLTELAISKAKKAPKEYKLFDGGGLFLLITPAGGKLWNLKYRFAGKEKKLALGAYPTLTLAEARQRREEAKKLIMNGVDPAEVRKSQKQQLEVQADHDANTFEKIAREWYEKRKPEWSEKHAIRLLRRLELDIFPFIGDKPIADIDRPELIELLQRVAVRTVETARRLKIAFHGVFRHAHDKGLIKHNPATDFRDALPVPKTKHMAAPTDPRKVAELMRAIDSFSGSFIVKCALQLTPILFVRPGELRSMEWTELNLEAAEWKIPGHKMKMKQPHLVPLAKQAVDILSLLQQLTGAGKYVFPCNRSPLKCMSENTINASLRRLGFTSDEIVAHGFRAMARTMLHEIHGFTPDAIEAQLAHTVPDRLGRAYNRTTHLQERKLMMQTWADYLDGLKVGAKVLPFKKDVA